MNRPPASSSMNALSIFRDGRARTSHPGKDDGYLPPLAELGGGIQDRIVAGRLVGEVEKRHLVLKRWFTEELAAIGKPLIDVGTDYGYPFFEEYPPTLAAIAAIGQSAGSARSYPSSYGTSDLRAAFAAFMRHRFAVTLDTDAQVMVSTGASQTFDALSRSLSGRFVVAPRLTLSTVTSIAAGNGAEILRVGDDPAGNPNLADLRQILRTVGAREVRFVYLNSPANPTGHVIDRAYLRQAVDLAREFGVLLVHDHDSWCTTHYGGQAPSILQIRGATDVAVTIVSLSKELGLPGVRVGLIAGNEWAVNALRMHNSEFCVMVPEFCQAAATAALTSYIHTTHTNPAARERVQEQITDSLRLALGRVGASGLAAPDPASPGGRVQVSPSRPIGVRRPPW
jgi:aspartate/methionine/tyrosine aminotransferase